MATVTRKKKRTVKKTRPVVKKTKRAAPKPKKLPSPQRIMEMTWSFAPPLMIEAAIRNKVFDALDGGAKTLDELVAATGASPRGIRALANGLVGLELLTRRGERFAMAPDAAAYLVMSKPSFMGGLLLHLSRQVVGNWLKLAEIVQTGKPAMSINQYGPGSDFFASFVEDIFNMSYPSARIAADDLLKKVKESTSVLDIAAGSGVWGIALAQRSPHVKVTAVDWPSVLTVTHKVAAKHNLTDRFSFVAGDILQVDFGADHNIATLGHILHSEGPERSKQLLTKVFNSLAPGGTIVIAEFLPDKDRQGPPIPLIFGVNMLVNTDEGDVFTYEEIKGWLEAIGFKKVRKLAGLGPSPMILADKPKK